METIFKLGPLQELWLKSLEEHPERQTSEILGKGTPENYKACCLGEYLLCTARFNNHPISTLFIGENIMDIKEKYLDSDTGDEDGYSEDSGLVYSYEKLGLRNPVGKFKTNEERKTIQMEVAPGMYFNSLASANDNGVKWTEIATFIRANPEIIFTKSV